jgi:hypothetical protein
MQWPIRLALKDAALEVYACMRAKWSGYGDEEWEAFESITRTRVEFALDDPAAPLPSRDHPPYTRREAVEVLDLILELYGHILVPIENHRLLLTTMQEYAATAEGVKLGLRRIVARATPDMQISSNGGAPAVDWPGPRLLALAEYEDETWAVFSDRRTRKILYVREGQSLEGHGVLTIDTERPGVHIGAGREVITIRFAQPLFIEGEAAGRMRAEARVMAERKRRLERRTSPGIEPEVSSDRSTAPAHPPRSRNWHVVPGNT